MTRFLFSKAHFSSSPSGRLVVSHWLAGFSRVSQQRHELRFARVRRVTFVALSMLFKRQGGPCSTTHPFLDSVGQSVNILGIVLTRLVATRLFGVSADSDYRSELDRQNRPIPVCRNAPLHFSGTRRISIAWKFSNLAPQCAQCAQPGKHRKISACQ